METFFWMKQLSGDMIDKCDVSGAMIGRHGKVDLHPDKQNEL